ncbi:hypothetical protein AAF712_012289 [Marasmius tenuissimus]|uniref:Uncharacterized protein n=1 Tax=Marasmius tenuissimus TaxID=585030 RepID=A0ABR2ZKA8_9AGAR
MAQRLRILLEASPRIASLIKDLRIRNMDDATEDGMPNTRGWLEDDDSLPQVLSLLPNLQRIYLAGSMSESLLEMASLPKPIKEALFETWRSPKLTHIGFQCVQFSSFKELLSVVSNCGAVQNITFFAVDVDDDLDSDAEPDTQSQDSTTAEAVDREQTEPPAGADCEIAPISATPESRKEQQAIDSLALFMEPELSSRFCAWLLGPQSNLALSSLQKFSLVAELRDNLKVVHRVVQASTSLREMNITIIAGDESYTVPFDISSLRIVHLGIDLAADEPNQCQTTLNWWCDNLTSSTSLSLTEFNVYILSEWESLVDFKYDQPAWERLDGIISADGCDIKLRVQIKCLEDEDNPLVPTTRNLHPAMLKNLEDKFPKTRDRCRLQVGQMHGGAEPAILESIFSHLGVYWA